MKFQLPKLSQEQCLVVAAVCFYLALSITESRLHDAELQLAWHRGVKAGESLATARSLAPAKKPCNCHQAPAAAPESH